MTAADVQLHVIATSYAGAITGDGLGFSERQANNNQRVIGRRKTRCIARFPCERTAVVNYRTAVVNNASVQVLSMTASGRTVSRRRITSAYTFIVE